MRRFKKEKKELLVKPKSYSGPREDLIHRPFQKTVNGLNPSPNFGKSSNLDARLGSEYAPVKNSV